MSRICEVGSEEKAIDLQTQSCWEEQSFQEHGGLPTGTRAHTLQVYLFLKQLNMIKTLCPYCLILYCTVAKIILLNNCSLMTKT